MKTALACALLLAAACDSTTGNFDLPDWSEGFPEGADGGPGGGDGGGGEGLAAGMISVRPTVDYTTRMGVKSSPEMDCILDMSGGYDTLECQAEARELDLYAKGFSYAIGFAADTCDYLLVQNYMYQAWEAGFGPTIVEYQVDENGNFLNDVAGSQGGEPYCTFDHSLGDDDAPNCCFGSYQVQVTVVPEVGEPYSLPLSLPKDWGGRPGDCYAGAAFTSNVTEISESTGLPKQTLIDISRNAGQLEIIFESPLDGEQTTNVWLSNYLEPSDDIPVGLEGVFSVREYRVMCLDHAEEHLGEIHFTIREWDEQAEFDADGDPNSGKKPTPESPRPLEDNGSGSPINDYDDWSDFVLDGNNYVHFDD